MIYTVTFNPSLDYVVRVEEFQGGKLNRSNDECVLPGGKGINVSHMLHNLSVDSVAMGFLGGFTGREIEERIESLGCKTDFIYVEGMSRINVKIMSDNETEINARGPIITREDIGTLVDKLKALKDDDMLVLAGSIPAGMSDSLYADIMKELESKAVKVVVDASGKLLTNTLSYKPFLIKPNNHELAEIFEENLKDDDDIIRCARKLKEAGAMNVLVSLGGDGAILIDEQNCVHMKKAYKGTVLNSVGAGDSMVAGFIAGYMENKGYEYALSMAVAAGSASAFSSGFGSIEEVMKLL